MQPVRLGALARVSISSVLLYALVMLPPSPAQDAPNNLETAQQVNDRIRSLSATARMRPHDYIIGPGDVLSVEVFDVKEISRDVRVSQTGTIAIPLVPIRLHVSGLTEAQAEQKIAEVLEADGLLTHAEVSVSVKDRKSKPITVVGAVGHSMVYQADRPVSVLEVLAEAGGVANDAGDTVIITRPVQELSFDSNEPPAIGGGDSPRTNPPSDTNQSGTSVSSRPALSADNSSPPKNHPSALGASNDSANPPTLETPPPLNNTITLNLHELMESGDKSNNIFLQAGDVVTVPHAGIVYVLGAVGRPGGFVLANDRTQMTTLKMLALAGGFNRTAKRDHAVIIRKDDQGKQHEVVVDLKKIVDRKAEDVQLLPADILYVPDSVARTAMLRAVELGVAVGTGLALYRIAYH